MSQNTTFQIVSFVGNHVMIDRTKSGGIFSIQVKPVLANQASINISSEQTTETDSVSNISQSNVKDTDKKQKSDQEIPRIANVSSQTNVNVTAGDVFARVYHTSNEQGDDSYPATEMDINEEILKNCYNHSCPNALYGFIILFQVILFFIKCALFFFVHNTMYIKA